MTLRLHLTLSLSLYRHGTCCCCFNFREFHNLAGQFKWYTLAAKWWYIIGCKLTHAAVQQHQRLPRRQPPHPSYPDAGPGDDELQADEHGEGQRPFGQGDVLGQQNGRQG